MKPLQKPTTLSSAKLAAIPQNGKDDNQMKPLQPAATLVPAKLDVNLKKDDNQMKPLQPAATLVPAEITVDLKNIKEDNQISPLQQAATLLSAELAADAQAVENVIPPLEWLPTPYFLNQAEAEEGWSDFCRQVTEKLPNVQLGNYPYASLQAPLTYSSTEMETLFKPYIPWFEQIPLLFTNDLMYLPHSIKVTQVSALKAPFAGHAQNNVAVRATFAKREVWFFFPDFMFLDSAQLSLLKNSNVDLNEFLSVQNVQPAPVDTELLSSGLQGFSINNIDIKSILSILSTLSFALPPPFGPLVAAGLSFISFLFGSNGNQELMTTLVKAVYEVVGKVIKEQDAITLIANINSFSKELEKRIAVMKDDPTNAPYMVSDVLPLLKDALDPSLGASFEHSLSQILQKKYFLPSNEKDKLALSAYQLIGVSVLTLSIIYKISLQIYALVGSQHSDNKDQKAFHKYTELWLGVFEEWYVTMKGQDKVKGMLDVLTQIRQSVIDKRVSCLSYHVNYLRIPNFGGGGPLVLPIKCYALDTWSGENVTINFGTTFLAKIAFGNLQNESKSKAAAAFDKLLDIPSIAKDIDFSMKLWVNHLTPTGSDENKITADFSHSTKDTPQGPWKKGAKVRYAVKFRNASGEATGPWSAYIDVEDKAFPTLSNVPIDPHRLTTARWIVRQFDKGKEQVLVPPIPDNTTTVWTDSNP